MSTCSSTGYSYEWSSWSIHGHSYKHKHLYFSHHWKFGENCEIPRISCKHLLHYCRYLRLYVAIYIKIVSYLYHVLHK